MKQSMWKIPVVAVAAALIFALGLLNLGLVTIAGSGTPMLRYQAEDVRPPAEPLQWSFDDVADGSLPEGAEVLSEARFGGWAVRREGDAPSAPNALCQTGMGEYPSMSLGSAVFGDLMMSTRFKPISGRVDQAAGLIFRVQDAENYYILRANALEGNVNLYKYASGRRSLINEGTASVRSGEWQELSVVVIGNYMRGFLNGEPVVEVSDDAYNAGRVGLWTKADSVTCFDDTAVSVADPTLDAAPWSGRR
jgi:hypothetical protein